MEISIKLHIVPAHERKYSTDKAAIAAWKSGVEFKTQNGYYLSIRDTPNLLFEGYARVIITLAEELLSIEIPLHDKI